jgi:octaprenyl-diphosphate synthase
MVEDGSLEVLSILSNASAVIAEGEVMQLMNVGDTNTTEDSYLQVISSKTAALFAAACEVGAVVADRPKAEAKALESYGRNLGIAFQLVDDALDYSAEQQALGKAIGDDFREGKVTLPILLAFRRGNAEERAFWKRVVEDGDQQDGDLERALEIIKDHSALEDTIERARHYGAMAKDALGIFEESEIKAALLEAVDFSIERAF